MSGAMSQRPTPAQSPEVSLFHQSTPSTAGGADLMLPGVDTELGIPLLKKGDICAVLSPGNPAPLAVSRQVRRLARKEV